MNWRGIHCGYPWRKNVVQVTIILCLRIGLISQSQKRPNAKRKHENKHKKEKKGNKTVLTN